MALLKSDLVRLAICQALANCVRNSSRHPIPIVEAKSDAVIASKIEFGKVAMHILGTVLVDALHAPLED